MQRLTGQDAYFLYQETPSVLMHTLKIAICAKPDEARTLEQTIRDIEAHLHLLPAFRRRVIPIPFGLHHPVYIEDPELDITFHVHRAAVPAPGGTGELNEVVAQIASHRLDRSRPLWELWLLEGLAEGRIAYVVKIHHAVADGVASAAFIGNVLVHDPEAGPMPAAQRWQPDPIPTKGQLVWGALRDHMRYLPRLFQLVKRSTQRVKAVKQRNESAAIVPPEPYGKSIIKMRFNGAVSEQRSFATATHSFELFRALKSALGGTVNDVLLAVTAGAIRQYLIEHDELPEVPLVAAVPVSADDKDSATQRLFGNRVAYFHTALRTDLSDPVERFQATRQVTLAAKEGARAAGEGLRHGLDGVHPATSLRVEKASRVRDPRGEPARLPAGREPDRLECARTQRTPIYAGPQARSALLGGAAHRRHGAQSHHLELRGSDELRLHRL